MTENADVIWACQAGRRISIHDTAGDADEYGFHAGDDEPYRVFPFRPQRWIPVAEQLPPCGTQILALGVTGRQFTCAYASPVRGWRDYDGTFWSPCVVTHWMPLPELPEVK